MRPLHRTSAPRIRESEDARGASGGVPSSGVEGVPSDRTQLRKAPLPVLEPLGPDDIAILRIESETVAGHALKIAILNPPLNQPRPDAQALRARIAARIERAPRLRSRLQIGSKRRAAWVDDPGFDGRDHVRAVPISGSLSDDDLRHICARMMEERLDRSHPLWTIDLLDPLENGDIALVWKLHHSLADGPMAMRFAEEVLWDSGELPSRPTPAAGSWIRSRTSVRRSRPGARDVYRGRYGGSSADRAIPHRSQESSAPAAR